MAVRFRSPAPVNFCSFIREAVVEKQKKEVRIDFVTGHPYPPVVGFDFGDFAILLTYDTLRGNGGFDVFYGGEYAGYRSRLGYEFRYFSKYLANFTFKMSCNVVEEICTTFRNHQTVAYRELFSLLESCTPRDILPRFFQET